ncbi:alpha/beta hydrolase-fold protein [Flavilitoribacter nigricans]|uniref:Gluconolactonase n=1 Tax=Flavilitoribacter nigricans (strain ATCC 23147 / DSM 23189 / NBRC 102662 / NCIMB 1420 / SS-2) TaxID=1122177 RepID=A0A2D0NG81_FLAN2|nr:alpha/beta hydrolase-fold protein [Flavilitoribacter nigricans]PHN07512.1 gluconolactonase [Flavilitoribacter nigricans DSM 23189 = NBRC 102662]
MNPQNKLIRFGYRRKQGVRLLILPLCFLVSSLLPAQESVPSSNSENYPSGRIEGPFSWKSRIYPGTERDYWIYVPAQYDPDKPACSMIVQDGLGRARGWGLPETLDSLTHAGKLPPILGIFVDHGKVAAEGEGRFPRFNRSFEYDGMGDRYARFLLEELIPEVERTYHLSRDPNDRCIAGASSGAICAFNAAWERPDAFHRVLSTIGTYVGLRGGDEFATLVRKSEPKPLRVFLEDGNQDLNIYAGDWWMANQDMLSALTWAGYEVEHIWGTEGHNSRGAKKILPEALLWLWKDYPQPVATHPEQYKGLALMLPDEPWREITGPEFQPDRLAVDSTGSVYFTDTEKKALYSLDNLGKPKLEYELGFTPGGLAFAGDGRLYITDLDHGQIKAFSSGSESELILSNVEAGHLLLSRWGLYFTDTGKSRIAYYSFDTRQLTYVELPGRPVGLSLSADQTFLDVSLADQVRGYSFKVTAEGHLAYGQPYIHYHIPYGQPTANTTAITVDAENRTYTASDLGIQVADQLGRINFIFSKVGQTQSDVKFGGRDLDTLYLISDGTLYRRKIQAKGVLPWKAAVQPPRPRM